MTPSIKYTYLWRHFLPYGFSCVLFFLGLSTSSTAAQSSQDSVSGLDPATLRKMADAGDAIAQSELGFRYEYGVRGLNRDLGQSVLWIKKSARDGNPWGELQLAIMYFDGRGVSQDYRLAFQWCERSANQGEPTAARILGEHYLKGDGTGQDFLKARQWLQKAADARIPLAQVELGGIYQLGLGIPPDYARAQELFEAATASTGDHSFALETVYKLKTDLHLSPRSSQVACNSSWSSEFDQVRDPEMLDSLHQDWEQKAKESGGTIQQLISSFEATRSQLLSNLERLKQTINDVSAEPVTNFDFDFDYVKECKNNPQLGASSAAACQYVNTQNALHATNGTIDILHCLEAGSSIVTRNTPDTGDAAAPAGRIDVRFSKLDSRPLTDSEMRALRDSIHWEPESAALSPGSAASSNLLDDKGVKLGSVLVRWDKFTSGSTAPSRNAGASRTRFTVQVENGTSCTLQSSAEIDDSQGFVVVSGTVWSGWLTLHQPDPGQTSHAEGSLPPNQGYGSLVLRPLTAYSTLSACTTPKTP